MLDAVRAWWRRRAQTYPPAHVTVDPALDVLGAATLPAEPTSARFKACVEVVLAHEGGYVDHPRDPGGATNLGITRATLADWRGKPVSKDDVRALSREEAEAIYHARYWRAVRADDLPAGLDLAVFDAAVNSGPGQAVRWLQRAVGADPDGVMGPRTLAAVRRHAPSALVFAFTGQRMAFLRNLPTWGAFGAGWTRRVMDVDRQARREAPM